MQWISIEDRMPEMGKEVLCVSHKRIFHSFWDNTSSSCDWYDIQNVWIIEDVTHWTALPDMPKEELPDLPKE